MHITVQRNANARVGAARRGGCALAVALFVVILTAGAPRCACAISINGIFDWDNTTPGPSSYAGSGDLISIFNTAINYWENAITQNVTINISFRWANGGDIGGALGLASFYVPPTAGTSLIRFNRDYSWFLDGSPALSTEYNTYSESNADLGGGDLNTGRVYTNPTGAAAGRYDLLSVALHEIGHVVGVNGAAPNNGSQYTVSDPRPFDGSLIPKTGGHINIDSANMYPSISVNVRRLLSEADILVAAEHLGAAADEINLNPGGLPEPSTFGLLVMMIGLSYARRRPKGRIR